MSVSNSLPTSQRGFPSLFSTKGRGFHLNVSVNHTATYTYCGELHPPHDGGWENSLNPVCMHATHTTHPSPPSIHFTILSINQHTHPPPAPSHYHTVQRVYLTIPCHGTQQSERGCWRSTSSTVLASRPTLPPISSC